MRLDYSKPSADVMPECIEALENDASSLQLQRKVSSVLRGGRLRLRCVVCAAALANVESFQHRGIDYLACGRCGHIQSRMQPPPDYPRGQGGPEFHQIYPRLGKVEYESRRDRIYRPKLEWALSCHQDLGLTRDAMLAMRWLDIGCGAGYFLSALADAGATRFSGLDRDRKLVEAANSAIGDERARTFDGALSEAVKDIEADAYVAFFVLEHIDETLRFFENMRHHVPGTLFLFSVPTFGFATLLESAFHAHSARHLDSVAHTQLFTDRSIRNCIDRAGYEIVAQWTFGQDAVDLRRLLLLALRDKYSAGLLRNISSQLLGAQDSLQSAIDRNALADSRHVLAVKK
jgi:2-polyprenyl-3-methyl-5-hydroxy-6-metoxy-1,4-benzoquinol methylase